jgi:hypothetical protein
MSAAIAARANATDSSPQSKPMAMPSPFTVVTTPVMAPASGWWSRTPVPTRGRVLVSRNALLAEISRNAAGEGLSAMRMHIRRLRQRDAMTDEPRFLLRTLMHSFLMFGRRADTGQERKIG